MLIRIIKRFPPLLNMYFKLTGKGPRERQMGETLDAIDPKHLARYRKACEWLQPGQRVLDVACGCGYGSAVLADAGAEQVFGVDISDEALAHARRHYARPAAKFVKGDLGTPDWKKEVGDEPFQLAVSLETLEHMPDPRHYLRDLAELMEPGGRLIVSSPNAEANPLFVDGAKVNPYHYKHWTVDELDEMLPETGFQLETWYGQTEDGMVEKGARDEAKYLLAVAKR